MNERTESCRVLFDERWYRNSGPDFEGDAYEHFSRVGWRDDRDPHPLFDVSYYLMQVPELFGGSRNPIEHYLEVGADVGIDPHPLFDSRFYATRYAGKFEGAPLEHYLREGAKSGFDPHLYFVSSYYLQSYPDVAQSDVNPLVHYAVFGGVESHRRPHPLFDAGAYAARRHLPAGVNPLMEFLQRLRRVRATGVRPAAPDVSAIVLNLNKSLMTIECVVELLDGASDALEVIVVDNGSAAGDFEHLANAMPPAARLIRLSTNRFFGEGNNIGADEARGRLLLFVNNDAFVTPANIAALSHVLDEFPDAGAVGPKFIYPDGRVQEAGAFVRSDGSVTQRGKFLDDLPDRFASIEPVDYVSAACVLIPQRLFSAVGGFDLTWDPAYYEDVDLCLKLELIGKRTYYCPNAVVMHIENATSSDASHGLRLSSVVEVNREKFIARWAQYLDHRSDFVESVLALPAELREPPIRSRTAVLYTPYALVPGGGERYLLGIAQALSRSFRTIVVTPERYSSYRLRGIASELRLDLGEVRIHSALDASRFAGCDLFIAMGNEVLPSTPPLGRRNVYICQFPFPMHANHVAGAWHWLDGYDDVAVYSEYAARHYRRAVARFGFEHLNVTVMPPYAPMYADAGPRGRVPGRILHVGRFAPTGHCKRQDTLVDAFRLLVESTGRSDLELHFVGSVAADPAAREYYQAVHQRARGLPVRFHLNAPSETMARLYATSSYYWHATGVGENVELFPERVEHFGISVVEAMSSGAIPLVYGVGGPAEIVDDGSTGFAWRDVEDLVRTQVRALAMGPRQSEEMRERAHTAARRYDTAAFESQWERFLGLGEALNGRAHAEVVAAS